MNHDKSQAIAMLTQQIKAIIKAIISKMDQYTPLEAREAKKAAMTVGASSKICNRGLVLLIILMLYPDSKIDWDHVYSASSYARQSQKGHKRYGVRTSHAKNNGKCVFKNACILTYDGDFLTEYGRNYASRYLSPAFVREHKNAPEGPAIAPEGPAIAPEGPAIAPEGDTRAALEEQILMWQQKIRAHIAQRQAC